MQNLKRTQAHDGQLKKQTPDKDSEYDGVCPWCGNKDKFKVSPEKGCYQCQTCGKTGNEIRYLMDRRGLSFKEACLFLGRHPGPRVHSTRPATLWIPVEAKSPKELWQMKARNFLAIAINTLWSKQGESIRTWLKTEKGLSDATIIKSMLGYTPMDIDEPRAAWGMEPLLRDGIEQRQRIPTGLVIPLIKNDRVMRLKIICDDPDGSKPDVMVSGSSGVPLIIGRGKSAVVIVESELDAWLLSQEAGDLCTVVALGKARAKPDSETDKLLQDASVILISFDTNETETNKFWNFWRDNYQAKRWSPVNGKDINEALLNGLNLRAWIINGLFGTEENFERFCIHTIDGRMSDKEAFNALGFK